MIPAEQPRSTASDAIEPTASPNPRTTAYFLSLHPWCIIRQLPNMQRVVIQRFRRRSAAEAHLKFLQRSTENFYLIVFDPGVQSAECCRQNYGTFS